MIPTYKARTQTLGVLLHASHTVPPQWHIEHKMTVGARKIGLLSTGYHFLIRHDGRLIETRPHASIGAHAKGGLSRGWIGVCLEGGLGPVPCEDCSGSGLALNPYNGEPTHCRGCGGDTVADGPTDNFTSAQWETLRHLRAYLAQFYGELPIKGHSEQHPDHHRQCPPVNMERVREWVR